MSFTELLRLFKICDKSDITPEELISLRDDFVDQTILLLEDYELYVETGLYGDQPVNILKKLGDFHLHVSTYIGVGEAISKRLKAKMYIKYSNETITVAGKQKKLPQTDKEQFSKTEVASLEGIVQALSRISYNIHERLESIRDSRSKF